MKKSHPIRLIRLVIAAAALGTLPLQARPSRAADEPTVSPAPDTTPAPAASPAPAANPAPVASAAPAASAPAQTAPGVSAVDAPVGIPQPLSPAQSTPICAPQPLNFNPVQACAQLCSCSCPGGILMPAQPSGGVVIEPHPVQVAPADYGERGAGAPMGGAPLSPNGSSSSGPVGANAAGSERGGYHSPGMFGYHRPVELVEEPSGYPNAQVDRPLILPNWLAQPELHVVFYNDSTNSASSVHERAQIGAEAGFADRWQAGAAIQTAVTPKVTLDALYAMGQYGLSLTDPLANARVSAGVRHSVCPDGSSSFSGGLGFAAKHRFNSHLSIVSGRADLQAFQVDDLVTWDSKSCGSTMTLGLPVGIEASLYDLYNFSIRSGYRHLLGNGASSDFIPLAFDFFVVVGNQADIGLSVELPNSLGTPSDFDRAQSFWFEQRITVFAQTRL